MPTIVLDGRRRIRITKCESGDLPDWVACTNALADLTIAEAKGSHDKSGPGSAFARAWKPVQRVDVVEHGRPVTAKRLAIVTRWETATGGPNEPRIAARDRVEEGHPIDPESKEAIFVGLFRHHAASMISRLGHADLAKVLRDLAAANNGSVEERATDRAKQLLDGSSEGQSVSLDGYPRLGDSVGGVVTRAGPMVADTIPRFDEPAFTGLDLRPVFVKIHRDLLKAAIRGNAEDIRHELVMDKRVGLPSDRSDGAGGWIIPLEDASEALE